MLRTAETGLKKWHHSNKRHPLIIRGARQVGKSTLVRDFALHEGMRLNEIDLYRNLHLADIFKTHDPVKICDELSGFLSRDVRAPGSLLFLDEIQAIPEAISALRYFHEEMPELPVVSAGSLLEFALTEHRFSMPVGRVEYMFLGPVTFSEFAAAATYDAPHRFSRGVKAVVVNGVVSYADGKFTGDRAGRFLERKT